MSNTTPIQVNREQLKRQQEKLRIAREALVRVEAKYARKRPVKHLTEPGVKMRAQQPGTER
jgi:hypothetical protein